jgi:molybdopterin molybdotransferase
LGIPEVPLTAFLATDYSFPPPLTHFLQVMTTIQDGKLVAVPADGKGSGDLANLSKVTGFLELPESRMEFLAGEVFPYFPFRPF